jgi:hypothetical protein
VEIVAQTQRINSLLKLKGLTLSYNPFPSRNAPAGVLRINLRLTNQSDTTLSDLHFQVTRLTGNNLLLNADGGPGGVGAILTIPETALGADGVLSPDESFSVSFRIGLSRFRAFSFKGDAFGIVNGASTSAAEDNSEGIQFEITEEQLQQNQGSMLYLPGVSR